MGRKVRVGTVDFDVVKPKLRCLATYANPKTGKRDLPILTTLTRVFGQEQPTFAVAMVPSRGGGRIQPAMKSAWSIKDMVKARWVGLKVCARFLSVHFCLTIRIRPISNSDG